jgi:hypothetical protein
MTSGRSAPVAADRVGPPASHRILRHSSLSLQRIIALEKSCEVVGHFGRPFRKYQR